MNRTLKVYNVTENTSTNLNLPYFDTLLEAQQHLLSCYNEVVQKHITANGTQLPTDMFKHAITPILSSYRVSAFISTSTSTPYNADTGEYTTPNINSFVKYYYYFDNDILENSDFFNNTDTFKIGTTEFIINSGIMAQWRNYGTFPYNYMSTDTAQYKAIFRFRNAFNSNYGLSFPVDTGGFTYLKMPCVYSDTSNNLYFGIINLALGQSPSNGRNPWSSAYYRVYNYSIPITEFNTQLPSISGDTTDEINTETGASDTDDSENNVGGNGNVTLINNVVNYDNYTPNFARVNTGFITPFEITTSELNILHSFLYGETVVDLIKNYFAGDATKAIVDLFNIPLEPQVEPTSTEIKVGVVPTGAHGNALSSETVTFNFGSIDITQGYNSNTFMDLDPYNKYMIYLPFIGFRNLNTNDIRSINDTGFKIYLKYVVDMLTGDFVAIIEADHNNAVFDNDTGEVTTAKLTKQVINTFSGNMRTAIPLTSINAREMINTGLGAITGAVASIATGNPLTMAMGAEHTLNSMASYNNALIPRGDSLSGNLGNLTINKAFIINQEAPKYIRTGKSNQFAGYPVFKYLKITPDRGYVKVKNVIMSNFAGTASEQARLEELLKKGVRTK